MPTKIQNVYQLVYLFCDDEAYEKSLFDLDTSDNVPEFKNPSENVPANVADEIPVSLDHKSHIVLVGDYSQTYRSQSDHHRLSMFPMINDHP